MKIDFQKLKEIEAQYCTSQTIPGNVYVNSELTLYALQSMLRLVLEYDLTTYEYAPSNVKLALRTLKELGIIVEEPGLNLKLVQQINS